MNIGNVIINWVDLPSFPAGTNSHFNVEFLDNVQPHILFGLKAHEIGKTFNALISEKRVLKSKRVLKQLCMSGQI